MTVEVTGSKYKRKTGFIIAIFLAGAALYCLYDGWINKEYQQNNIQDGKPTANLMFNRFYFPIGAAIAIAYFVITSMRMSSLRIVANDTGLTISGGTTISYTAITQIDKRFFDKEGHFTVGYTEAGLKKRLKLSERNYDHLGVLLDELVKRTGAAPPDDNKTSDQ